MQSQRDRAAEREHREELADGGRVGARQRAELRAVAQAHRQAGDVARGRRGLQHPARAEPAGEAIERLPRRRQREATERAGHLEVRTPRAQPRRRREQHGEAHPHPHGHRARRRAGRHHQERRAAQQDEEGAVEIGERGVDRPGGGERRERIERVWRGQERAHASLRGW